MHRQKNNRQRILLSYRWLIFSILAIGYAIVYFHRVAPAVVAPELSESFAIKGGALGVLASAYFYPYALMQIPSGLLSDSLGPKKNSNPLYTGCRAGSYPIWFIPHFF